MMECQEAFEKIKKKIQMSDLFLTYYDPKKEIFIASDSRAYGIGACIMHKLEDDSIKQIAHTSRVLLPAEQNYSVIEKKSLWIVFALKKFHRFIHGRQFTLQTDHKPLLVIYGSKK